MLPLWEVELQMGLTKHSLMDLGLQRLGNHLAYMLNTFILLMLIAHGGLKGNRIYVE